MPCKIALAEEDYTDAPFFTNVQHDFSDIKYTVKEHT